MIAVEEKDLQSVKTDASLYNGQPTDTGTQCHNVGVTSSTPSILKNKDGVSVESVHTHSKQVCIEGIIRKAKEIIDARNIESVSIRPRACFFPSFPSYLCGFIIILIHYVFSIRIF